MSSILLALSGMSDLQYGIYITLMIIFIIAVFLASLAAIVVVLFQKSNSEGIQGITATSETFFGKNKGRSIESKLKRWAWISLIVIAVISITVYIVQIVLS